MSELIAKGREAKEASMVLANASSNEKNLALKFIAEALVERQDEILLANKIDLDNAEKKGTSKAMLDRLALNEGRIKDMATGVLQLVELQDPVGEVISMWKRPNGLQIGQQRVPLGVVGIIYEARPNVTVDAAALCLKTGNAVILRGGSEAINSNKTIVNIVSEAIEKAALPKNSVQIIEDTSREVATEFMKLNEYLDVLIPRGGAGLIQSVVKNATVPVIETGTGNCHIYVDDNSDLIMAKDIIVNAKTSRPAVCNAAESLLVHEAVAEEFLPLAVKELMNKGVEIRGCENTRAIVKEGIKVATEEDWKSDRSHVVL